MAELTSLSAERKTAPVREPPRAVPVRAVAGCPWRRGRRPSAAPRCGRCRSGRRRAARGSRTAPRLAYSRRVAVSSGTPVPIRRAPGAWSDGRSSTAGQVTCSAGSPTASASSDGQPEGLLGRRRHEDVHGRQDVRDLRGLPPPAEAAVPSHSPSRWMRSSAPSAKAMAVQLVPYSGPSPASSRCTPGSHGDGPYERLEALAGHEPSHPADHEGALGEPEPRTRGGPRARGRSGSGGVDAVGHRVHPRGGHAPAAQPLGDGVGDGDRGRAEPLGGQVQRADPGGERGGPRSRVSPRECSVATTARTPASRAASRP